MILPGGVNLLPRYFPYSLSTKFRLIARCGSWTIERSINVGAKVAYHSCRSRVHAASAFPLVRCYAKVGHTVTVFYSERWFSAQLEPLDGKKRLVGSQIGNGFAGWGILDMKFWLGLVIVAILFSVTPVGAQDIQNTVAQFNDCISICASQCPRGMTANACLGKCSSDCLPPRAASDDYKIMSDCYRGFDRNCLQGLIDNNAYDHMIQIGNCADSISYDVWSIHLPVYSGSQETYDCWEYKLREYIGYLTTTSKTDCICEDP